jgi:hypothetical protein
LIPGRGKGHDVWTYSGDSPASYKMGAGGSLPGGEADHWPPSSAEVKNGGAISPLPYTSSRRGA